MNQLQTEENFSGSAPILNPSFAYRYSHDMTVFSIGQFYLIADFKLCQSFFFFIETLLTSNILDTV